MAIDVKTLACPQCGSIDVKMESENRGLCNSCGARFAVQPRIDAQNYFNEVHIHSKEDPEKDESYIIAEILPEFSKEEFLREAWIKLAKEDAPLEVFSEDFGEVQQRGMELLMHSVSADLSYQVSVGYNREEPYIDYEKYYEKEPYQTTEEYYDSATKSNRTRQVTKYQRVERQRQVTKYRTVTDWSALSGNHNCKSTVFIENEMGMPMDKGLFLGKFFQLKKGSTVPAYGLQLSDRAQNNMQYEHRKDYERSLELSIPGDHYKNLDYSVARESCIGSFLYKIPKYYASISYNGKSYWKSTYPFGNLQMEGDTIPNEVSLNTIKKNKKNELAQRNKERTESVDRKIAEKSNGISIVTIMLLIFSIIISLFVRNTAAVVLTFAAAAAAFIYNTIYVNKISNAEKKKVNQEIQEDTANVEAEISDCEKNYKEKRLEALNAKLQALGFEPVSESEITKESYLD